MYSDKNRLHNFCFDEGEFLVQAEIKVGNRN